MTHHSKPTRFKLGMDSTVGIPVIRTRGDHVAIIAYITAPDPGERAALAEAVVNLLVATTPQPPAPRASSKEARA
jgi:hypothetical protein